MSRSTTAAVPEFIAPHFIAQEITWQSNEDAEDAPMEQRNASSETISI
jgi:hypothetical protein